ncbi:DMT family transporter [Acaryochloris sp. IP29b_bin.137]|uniref:DMT family transporter n=1 Tax=Acaryochloris sp. IP29b_bin.137 TaxID=2969217 RepID=UPI0026259CAA|nr:DMT family transporter [Acaryochloris sp. IP29b_bin.137]
MLGEIAAVCAACLWAIASVIYATLGQQASALALNLGKGVIAILLLVLTIGLQRLGAPPLAAKNSVLLLLSGAIGIGFGDTVYLEALRHLGARRTLLLGTLAPPMAACLALWFLQEQLSPLAWLGMAVTILGIVWVISERTAKQEKNRYHWLGLLYALFASLAQAIGAILSRTALENTPISPQWGALLRLLAGVAVVLVWGIFQRQLRIWWQTMITQSVLIRLFAASFAGTYLGIWLQQVSLKYTVTGISQTLNATSPLFVLPIAIILGERVSFRAWLGAITAIMGVGLLLAQTS